MIRSRNIGGAERQLLTLLAAIDRSRIEPVVVTFYSEGELLSEVSQLHVKILSAKKSSRWDVLPFISRLIKIIRLEKPDILVAYLVAANLLAIMLKPFFLTPRVVTSIRHSFVRQEDYDWLTTLLYSLENKLAGWSDLIILNSYTGAEMAKTRGIPAEKMVVIPNGIDTDRFHSDLNAREETRNCFKIKQGELAVGIIGRIDPIKGHDNFIQAANRVRKAIPGVKFLIVGSGEKQLERELVSLANSLGLSDNIIWVPSQKDLIGIYNALDVYVSSSIGEIFQLISEAMSCGIPCIVMMWGIRPEGR